MSSEIAQYAASVGVALADLPADLRQELLDDLPAHLAEVAAEAEADGVTLAERLGPPQAYAAELRATLGHTGDHSEETSLLALLGDRIHRAWDAADRRAGPVFGYDRISSFGRLLRPAWWVLRAYLATMLIARVGAYSHFWPVIPRPGGSAAAGLALLLILTVGSVWLGTHPVRSLLLRLPLAALTAVLAGFAMIIVFTMDAKLTGQQWATPTAVSDVHFEHMDLYPYDEHGDLLTGVRLRDRDGSPVEVLTWCADTVRMAETAQQEPPAGQREGWSVSYPTCAVPDSVPRRIAPAAGTPIQPSPSPGPS